MASSTLITGPQALSVFKQLIPPRGIGFSSQSRFWKMVWTFGKSLFSWEMDPLDQAATMKIDITPFVDLKIKALLQHKSQISDPNEAAKSVRDVASALGGASGIQYAEWYTRVLML
jgi:LmbE family N-acetylglucosaminyl deacetylase